MAIMKIDVYAKTMNRTVTLEVIAPVETLKPGDFIPLDPQRDFWLGY